MKNLRNLIVAFILLVGFQAQAQIKVGVTGGLNASQFNIPVIKDLGIVSVKRGIGLTTGVFVTAPLVGPLSVRAEGNYMSRDYVVKIDPDALTDKVDIPFNITAHLKSRYYEVPLLLQVNLGSGSVSTYLLGGGAVSGYMNSKLGVGVLGVSLVSIPINNIGFRKTEWSVIGGAGMRVDMGFADFILEGRYQHGLTNLVNIPSLQGVNVTPNNRNNSIVFKAGVAIPITRTNRSKRHRSPVASL